VLGALCDGRDQRLLLNKRELESLAVRDQLDRLCCGENPSLWVKAENPELHWTLRENVSQHVVKSCAIGKRSLSHERRVFTEHLAVDRRDNVSKLKA